MVLNVNQPCKEFSVKQFIEKSTLVLGTLLHTSRLAGKHYPNPTDIEQFIMDADWAFHSTHHTILGFLPKTAVSG